MAAHAVISYDVSDPEVFQQYNPGSLPVIMQTMMKHGGRHWRPGATTTGRRASGSW